MFMLGVFGGGDAKVLAAATVWTGLSPALSQFLLWTCIAGGVLAALAIVSRKRLKPAPSLPGFVNTFLGENAPALCGGDCCRRRFCAAAAADFTRRD